MKKTISTLDDLIALLGLIALIGCGGGGLSSRGDASHAGLDVTVKNVTRAIPRNELGAITTYRVVVSGPGIDPDIEAEFVGTTSGGIIDDVPPGSHRVVTVTATNSHGQPIWAGEAKEVTVQGGTTAHATIDLESVPIFANLNDRAHVDNTRFAVRTFSSAAESVSIDDQAPTGEVNLADAATAVTEIASDLSTGLGELRPRLLPVGDHVLTVRSLTTGRSSRVSIYVSDGSRAQAASLFSTGNVARGSGATIWRAGETVPEMKISLKEGL